MNKLVLAVALSMMVALGGAATVGSAQADIPREKAGAVQVSCWVNVFAWVSTSPSHQGNLSSIVSCNATVRSISQTMYVRDYYTGAIVATVGPVTQFNVMSGGIAYQWYCNQLSPRTLWGQVQGTVTDASGAVSTGSWSTQVLSC